MKLKLRPISLIVMLLLGVVMFLSSCRMLMGDPRKNCNHPNHGEYLMEKRLKQSQKR